MRHAGYDEQDGCAGRFDWQVEIDYRDPKCRAIQNHAKTVKADTREQANEIALRSYKRQGIPAWVTRVECLGRAR